MIYVDYKTHLLYLLCPLELTAVRIYNIRIFPNSGFVISNEFAIKRNKISHFRYYSKIQSKPVETKGKIATPNTHIHGS